MVGVVDKDDVGAQPGRAAGLGRVRLPAWQDFRVALAGAGLLVLLIATAEAAPAAQWLWFLQPARFVLGLAYVLFVPGYCLTAAFFPRRNDIDTFDRLAFSLGLSVAWLAVLALILDLLPWGLRLWPIVLGQLASMLLFMAAALWHRERLPPSAVAVPDFSWRLGPWWRSLEPFERRLLGLAGVAVLVAALVAAQVLLVPSPADFTTELYMLGAEGLAESYPRAAAVGEEIGVTLGVTNLERDDHAYRVEVWAVDPWAEDRRQLVDAEQSFDLPKGEQREWRVAWQMPWAGDDQMVELYLFQDGGAEPYRSLRLWLNVTEAQP